MAKSEDTNLPITNKPYISCIRIHGLRILPPILTEEKRHRMQYYKELAIKVEQRIKNRNLTKQSPESTDDSLSATYVDSNSSTISDSVIYSSDEEPTFKSQIFTESCRSDVLKMLNDSPKAAITVPLTSSEESDTKKCLLIKNMNDLPENQKPNRNSDSKTVFSSDNNAENEKSSIFFPENGAGDNIKCLGEKKDSKSTTPLLIRSNSYTLDAPSPFLIAFMKENNIYSPDTKETNSKKRRTWDLEKAREKWSSIEHDLNIVADKNLGNKRHDSFNSLPTSSVPSPEIKLFNSKINIRRSDSSQFPERDTPPVELVKQPPKRVVTAPAKINSSTKFITSFATPQNLEKDTKKTDKTDLNVRQRKITNEDVPKKEIKLPKRPNIISCEKSEHQIREIIDKIHSEQSKQMSDLIARQKKEQEHLMKLFAEQQALVLSKLKHTYRDIEETKDEITNEPNKTPTPGPDILKNSENLLVECKKLLLQETLSPNSETSTRTFFSTSLNSSSDETLASNLTLKSSTPSPKEMTDLKIESVSSNSRFSNSFSLDSLEPNCTSTAFKTNHLDRRMSCSRQLFPTTKQTWAATKINALARGYLIRRLIKTDRVQNLIKTIRDTLLCAMQLHHETAEQIQPADVELHRRLIQQVTAACYSFHDTFFELSKSDQMSIIALDRDRQKEKLLRPLSAKSNVSLSSTTQKVLERKLRRSSDTSGAPSRSSSSRSCHSANEFRDRAKSLGLSDSMQSSRKTSPQNEVMRRAMSYGANKKPWR